MSEKDVGASTPPVELEVAQEIHNRGLGLNSTYETKIALLNWHIENEVGWGRFQYEVTALAAFGWFVDNAWFQCVYVATPQVQLEFAVDYIGWASLSLYVGLIVGTFFWATTSDIIGRKPCFITTLLISSIFGLAAGGANDYVTFCALLACTGLGVGGNIPVDSALYLEFIPGTTQWMLTLLSMFWSFGTLFVALIGWGFIATYSCPETATSCTREENMGWRYVFYTTGAVVLAMWIIRFLYGVPESPKYLLARGQDAEAVAVVHHMAKRNGRDCSLTVEKLLAVSKEGIYKGRAEKGPSVLLAEGSGMRALVAKFLESLKHFDLQHIKALFSTVKVAVNTILITIIWGLIGAASPLYNAFIIVFISEKGAEVGQSSTYTTYRQYAITSTVGIPAAIVAAGLVELPHWGRKGAMASSTLLTGVFLFLFTTSRNPSGILGWNCALSFTQDVMYGVLYAYTPESFPAPQRGTGYAVAMTFNRIMGVVGLLIGRYIPLIPTTPVYVSASLFLAAGFVMAILPIETKGKMAV